MAKRKVLYVDDHIPDDSFPDEKDQIKETLKKRYSDWNDKNIEEWTKIYYYARQVIRALQDAGYEVETANKYRDAMKLVESSHFDIAIVDLGWFNDRSVPRQVRQNFGLGNVGWPICDKIKEIDVKEQRRPTLQIAYSHRFVEQPELSVTAAQKGTLPFFKDYQDTNAPALTAVVEFLNKQLAVRSSQEQPAVRSPEDQFAQQAAKDFHQTVLDTFRELQVEQKQWFVLTMICVAISLFLVAAGTLTVIFWNVQVGTLASISSAITAFISSLLFVQLQRSRNALKESRAELTQLYRDSLERHYGTAIKQPEETASSDAASSQPKT